jgi:hypothetical protein
MFVNGLGVTYFSGILVSITLEPNIKSGIL